MAYGGSRDLDQGNRRYVASVMAAPILERDHEFELARRWRDDDDTEALHELIEAYARFVVRIAWKFRGYGLPIGDLVQEGNVGLMEAARRFDPDREARFSTYASWWIMAAIQDYVLRHTSIVRVATTPAQRRLFFNLRRVRAKLATGPDGTLTDADRVKVAERLGVKVADVERMEAHLGGPDSSLDAGVGEDEDNSWMDMLADDGPTPEDIVSDRLDSETRSRWLKRALATLSDRERKIIVRRFLDEDRLTLSEIGDDFGVSKERVRQIEAKALAKLRDELGRYATDENGGSALPPA
ncbi:MAG: RNA polymerase factor sigma-32 [Alphaproteobacteria bacterium]